MKEELREFAQRLDAACDNHPDAPPPKRGRQRWLATLINVSPEASRKWFSGLARPRPPVMRRIAEALKVDEAWLALGITPTKEPQEREAAERKAAGAIYYVAGLIEMEGGTVAFPEAEDLSEGVDLFVTMRGRQRRLHVAATERTEPGRYRTTLPTDTSRLLVLAVVMGTSGHCPRVLFLPPDMLERHAEARGGYRQLEMIADDGEYLSGEDVWPEVSQFRDLVGGLLRAS